MDYERLDSVCREAMSVAQSLAVRSGDAEIVPEHLLLALSRMDRAPAELRSTLESHLERTPRTYSTKTGVAPGLAAVLERAACAADEQGSGSITTFHLLIALAGVDGMVGEQLKVYDIADGRDFGAASTLPPDPDPTRPDPIVDLVVEAARGKLGATVGRDDVTSRLIEVLVKAQRQHPVLIGEPGVGRTAVIHALAEIIARDRTPPTLRGVRLLSVTGSFDDTDALWKSSTRALVHIADHRVFAQAMRALRAALPDCALTLIGRATPEEYFGTLSRQPYLEDSVSTLLVEPLSVATSVLVLRGLRARVESRHRVRVREDALDAAAELAVRHLPNAKLPGSAIELLDASAALRREKIDSPPLELDKAEAQVFAKQAQPERSERAESELSEMRTAAGWLRFRWEQEKEAYERIHALRTQLSSRHDEALARRLRQAEQALSSRDVSLIHADVTPDDVSAVVEQRTGVRLGGPLLDARAQLVRLEKNLGDDVLGQRRAMRAIASALMRASVRLQPSAVSGASFHFTGPAGVGKTETARSLARHFLNDERAMVELKSDDAGAITDALARSPKAVVVVQDIESASNDVVRLLSRVLDDEPVQRSNGARADLRGAFLVVCSRAARVNWLSRRVGAVVEFSSLSRDILRILTDRKCRELSERLCARRVALEWSDASLEWLAQRGYDRDEGAHRLARVLADEVGAPLGRMLVLGELTEGSRAEVRVQGSRLDVIPLESRPATGVRTDDVSTA